jgi:hypothetical protein
VNIRNRVRTLVLGAVLATAAGAQAQQLQLHSCIVDEVQVFQNRVHVRCGPGSFPDFPRFFASPTSNSAESTRLATLGTVIMATSPNLYGRLMIWYDPNDHAAASYDCGVNDCRRPVQIWIPRNKP